MGGWNKPSGAAKPEPKKPSAKGVLGVWCLVLGAALGVGAYFLFSGGDDAPARSTKHEARGAIKEVASSKSPKGEAAYDGKESGGAKAKGTVASAGSAGAAAGAEADTTASNAVAGVEKPKTTKTKSIFPCGTDQVIAMALCHPKGAAMPPLPDIGHDAGDEEFINSLKKPLVVEEDDPAPIRKIKETVNEARLEIAKILQEDPKATVKSILEEHREDYNHKLDLRSEALTELEKVKSEGTEEDVRKYVTMMNLALQQVGVEEITDKEAYGTGDEDEEQAEPEN